jgi:DNA polymerase-3 subunit delta
VKAITSDRKKPQELARVTLVFGDEPLLIEEAADEVRSSALALGFEERLVLTVEPKFDWSRLDEAANSMSLFAARRLIDLRMPGGKPGDAGSQALVRFCVSTQADTALLLICGRLDGRTRQAKWFKAIEKTGRLAAQKSVPPPRLPSWIQARARAKGLTIDQDAAMLLSHYTEGNLLATAQEIDKLELLESEPGAIRYDDVAGSITDSARFNVYALVDHCLAGDAAKAVRSLTGLRHEGIEPIIIVWTLANQVRTLYGLSRAVAAGRPRAQLFKSFRIWSQRAPLVNSALDRFGERGWAARLQEIARLDRILKGRDPGFIWSGLEQACLALCDTPYVRVPA